MGLAYRVQGPGSTRVSVSRAKGRKWLVIVSCAALGVALPFLARELSEWLMSVFPHRAGALRTMIGLLVVYCLGIFALRPLLVTYRSDP